VKTIQACSPCGLEFEAGALRIRCPQCHRLCFQKPSEVPKKKGKHPKDVARRKAQLEAKGKGRKRRNKRGNINKAGGFDSSLGFPGEGWDVEEAWNQAWGRRTERGNQPPLLNYAHMYLVATYPTYVALRTLADWYDARTQEPTMLLVPLNDAHRILIGKIHARAEALLLTRDLNSPTDKTLVLRAMASEAQKSDHVDLLHPLSETLAIIYSQALASTIRSRRLLVRSTRFEPFRRSVFSTVHMLFFSEHNNVLSLHRSSQATLSVVTRLQADEKLQPQSFMRPVVTVADALLAVSIVGTVLTTLPLTMRLLTPVIRLALKVFRAGSLTAEEQSAIDAALHNSFGVLNQWTCLQIFLAGFWEEPLKYCVAKVYSWLTGYDLLIARRHIGYAFATLETGSKQFKTLGSLYTDWASRLYMHGHRFVQPTLLSSIRSHVMWNVFILYTQGFEMSYDSGGDVKNAAKLAVVHHDLTEGFKRFIARPSFLWRAMCFDLATNSNGPYVHDVCAADYGVRESASQPAFSVRWGEFRCVPGFGSRAFLSFDGSTACVFRSCTHNERLAILGRVAKALPMHGDDARMQAVNASWHLLTHAVGPLMFDLIRYDGSHQPLQQWMQSFEPKRRNILQRLYWESMVEPKQEADMFTKRELALKPTANPTFKEPRAIQGCDPILSKETGPHLRRLAKAMRDSLDPTLIGNNHVRGQQIIYTCGLSNEEIGRKFGTACDLVREMLLPGEHLVFLEDDQSRFDMHLTHGPFYFASHLYARFLPRRLRRLLHRRISRGRSGLGTRYSLPYTMQSGWPDTSFIDTAVNNILKYAIHGFGGRWIAIVCGDDSVVITTSGALAQLGFEPGITALYALYGMEVTCAIRHCVEDVEFCSSRFLVTAGTTLLVPKIGKILGRLLWDKSDRNPANQRAWLRGINNVLANYGQVDPLLKTLSKRIEQQLGQGRIIQPERTEFAQFFDGSMTIPLLDSLYHYQHNYGWSTTDYEHASTILSQITLPQHICDPLLCAMVATDQQ